MDATQRVDRTDAAITEMLATASLPMLRASLGVVYVWFGALKVTGASPVADFVADTLPFLPRRAAVLGIGLWEMTIGAGLLARVALRPMLILFAIQLAGTFLPFLTQPRAMFQRGNPLLLTTEGEFVLKNLVLLAAGVAVGSSIRRKREDLPASDGQLRQPSSSS
ncbi:hypothetical protein F8S13_11375 [Chloroflexia bacterium SDU3-3]|nr:hypothetical protein F8S13_11375 [Chloroflexia bacterium SDU3-3]